MAGDIRLEGELNAKALKMMAEVADVLERFNISYMLDCGTLLGVVREQRILPWDNDMDFCAPIGDLPKLRRAALALWMKGYRVRFARATQDWGPIRKGDPRILRVRNRKQIFSRGPLLLDIFIRYPHDSGQHITMLGEGEDVQIQAYDQRFLVDRSALELEGRSYPVPKDYDGYLTHRYGDWRTPVENWDFRNDDNSRIQ